ncbi:MAG TPA: class I SAM-dependent methyltransferase [Gaiellaceae bacterium]|jgi:SAM-dependent methyltransferase|nr:class I SAM-dependent methyltransferase [Gaiellaceae bacterium]
MDVNEFVLAELPPPPFRVLEVGCGRGELAETLAQAGYFVVAIDPDAPEGPLFRRATLENFADPEIFDGAVASRSLHHVPDLTIAVDKIAALLHRGGVLVLDEFAWDRLDGRSAREVGIDLGEWRAEHEGLHTSAAMLDTLATRFSQRRCSWEPYLYREQRQAVDEALERELIRSGRLAAIGFRYVGVR